MTRRKFIPAALASAILLATPLAAMAQPARSAPTEDEVWRTHKSRTEMDLFQKARISMLDAIAAAERHTGGRALEAGFELRSDRPVYKVAVFHNNAVWIGLVDANSGQVQGESRTTPLDRLGQEDRAEVNGLQRAKLSLADAIKAAEQQSGDRAIEAGMEQLHDRAVYEVVVLRNGATRKLAVDPASGQVTQG